jgi:hypothetical protein
MTIADSPTLTPKPRMVTHCLIDTSDWQPGASDADRQQCEDRLTAWFAGLSSRTQLSIYYAQRHREWYWQHIDLVNDHGVSVSSSGWACPFLEMVERAENRIWRSVTKNWLSQPQSGYNFYLTTYLHLTE